MNFIPYKKDISLVSKKVLSITKILFFLQFIIGSIECKCTSKKKSPVMDSKLSKDEETIDSLSSPTPINEAQTILERARDSANYIYSYVYRYADYWMPTNRRLDSFADYIHSIESMKGLTEKDKKSYIDEIKDYYKIYITNVFKAYKERGEEILDDAREELKFDLKYLCKNKTNENKTSEAIQNIIYNATNFGNQTEIGSEYIKYLNEKREEFIKYWNEERKKFIQTKILHNLKRCSEINKEIVKLITGNPTNTFKGKYTEFILMKNRINSYLEATKILSNDDSTVRQGIKTIETYLSQYTQIFNDYLKEEIEKEEIEKEIAKEKERLQKLMEFADEIIETAKNNTLEEITKAYRILVLKYHPDKNGGSTEKFIQLQQAFNDLKKALNSKKNSPEQ